MTHVQFDEIENVLVSLDLVALLAPVAKRRQSRSYWKWLIVGVHDALQGAIVCAVADTAKANILSERSARKMLDWLEDTSQEYPREHLADFNTLLKRAAINLSPAEAQDIGRLHEMRNDFAHFTPKGWSIELAGLPRIIGVALRLVEHLMDDDQVQCRLTGNRKRRALGSMKAARVALGIAT